MKIKQIRAYVNKDAISSIPGIKGQIEFYYILDNDDTEYGVEYLSFRNEEQAYEYCNKLNDLNINTWEQYNKFEKENIDMLFKHLTK